MIDNLLGNAAKYSPSGSSIHIQAYRVQDCCSVEIGDTGIGMTPEQLGQAFDMFYRADASNTAREGLGLGLTIARNIAQAHDGRLWLESALGQGTTAIFQLPCHSQAPCGE